VALTGIMQACTVTMPSDFTSHDSLCFNIVAFAKSDFFLHDVNIAKNKMRNKIGLSGIVFHKGVFLKEFICKPKLC
jgi:hypothetical protein